VADHLIHRSAAVPRKRGLPITKRGRLSPGLLRETIHEAVDLDRGNTRFDDFLDLTEDLTGQPTRRTHAFGESLLGVPREVAILGLVLLTLLVAQVLALALIYFAVNGDQGINVYVIVPDRHSTIEELLLNLMQFRSMYRSPRCLNDLSVTREPRQEPLTTLL
jgi:hypothetical protein